MPRPTRPTPETQRLATQAVAFARGQEAAVLAWLERLGCRIAHRRENTGEWILDGPSGIRAGLSRGLDPVTTAVQLGFLLAGPLWPVAFPRLVETADRVGRAQATAVPHTQATPRTPADVGSRPPQLPPGPRTPSRR